MAKSNLWDRMHRHYLAWQSSGLSQRAYSKQSGLHQAQFNYWVVKFRSGQRSTVKEQSGFAPVVITPNSNIPVFEIHHSNGHRLSFYEVLDASFIIAPAPSRTVKSGLFDESVLAFLLVSKYTYHLPLHRIKQMFTREKIPISSSTLSDNVAATIRALEPIYRALIRETLAAKYLQSDETVCLEGAVSKINDTALFL
ncbi:MAG: IS66 family insertion sequence element accessory protein TnpA [Sphingobacterium sp.]